MSDQPCERAQQETAAYIRDMAIELAAMARAAQCHALGSVLEMAELEAGRLVEDGRAADSVHPPLNGPLSKDAA